MIEIDENMKDIVRLLNKFPGIETMSCCGGHKNPDIGQMPEGEWYVNFDVCDNKGYPTKAGWGSVGKILQAIDACTFEDANVKIALTLWNPEDREMNPRGIASLFELKGKCNSKELDEFCYWLNERLT